MQQRTAVERLRAIGESAEAVLQAMEGALPSDDAEVAALMEQVESAAKKAVRVASSPVKIGVVGEFSSGKTLLLGALIGYADALPVSEIPTTGNVTALRFVPVDERRTTRVDGFKIEYLDHAGARDCLAHLLKEAADRLRAARVPLEEQALAIDPAEPRAWTQAWELVREAWDQSKDPDLRYLLRELAAFVRAYASHGERVCGTSVPLAEDMARAGLTLGDPPMDIRGMGFDDLFAKTLPGGGADSELRETFPLIWRAEATVEISREVWDLSRLRGVNEFVLLDFPGLGAASSGVRDAYLCLRELAETQTILVLLNSRAPGGGRALNIFNMMQRHRPAGEDLRDCILVGAGRFDQLPIEGDGGEGVLEDLAGSRDDSGDPFGGDALGLLPGLEEEEDSAPPTEEAVLERLKVLRTLMADAQAFASDPSRIVFLSPMLALADQADRAPDIRAGSDAFAANMMAARDRFASLRKKWRALGERLSESGGGGHLGRRLGYFAQDGGVGRLRELIGQHVAEHGLKQLAATASQAARELQRAREKLERRLAAEPDGPSVSEARVNEVRKAFLDLARVYTKIKADYEKAPPELRARSGDRAVPVSVLVRESVVVEIFGWGQWGALLDNARNGYIEPPQADSVVSDLLPELEEETSIPTKSDDFLAPFEASLSRLEGTARACMRTAVAEWLEALSDEVGPQRAALMDLLLDPEVRAKVAEKMGKREVGLLDTALVALEPHKLEPRVVQACQLAENSPKTLEAAPLFPLARADAAHPRGKVLGWDPDMSAGLPRHARHQVQALRYRDEFVASAGQAVAQLAGEANKRAVNIFLSTFGELIRRLQLVSGNHALLAILASRGAEQPPEDWRASAARALAVEVPAE